MMKVQHEIGHALGNEPADDAPDHRLAGDRNRRLCTDITQRAQPGAVSGGQNESVTDHANGAGGGNGITQRNRGTETNGLIMYKEYSPLYKE